MNALPMACLLAGMVVGGPETVGPARPPDLRNIQTGVVIPDEGYCDQPYVVITADGNWLCTLTTGKGHEGQDGQHIVATISADKGKTWSPLIDIEPADGPAASWAMPLVTPSGRVYVFYDYNGDRVDSLNGRKIHRVDMLGWYVYKYSDDNGRTWSAERYRLPVRETEMDRNNDFGGRVQMLWGIGKPIIAGRSVYLGFSKIGRYLIDLSEGWFFRSDNMLTEADPAGHKWIMLPDGETGLRSPGGPIAEEQNLVALGDGSLYTVYRTVEGHPCHAYSRDRGHTWTPPAYATYTPGGRLIKNPRACPRLWRAKNGNYLLWFHNHGGRDFEDRNPAWILGGIEKDGRIHWSQPEILFYDPDPTVRISYPDLIEQDGRCWITETQKTVARVHEVDPTLLDGLWKQATNHTIARRGLVLDLDVDGRSGTVTAPTWPDPSKNGGFTIEMWVEPHAGTASSLPASADRMPAPQEDRHARNSGGAARQVLLDSRDIGGKGIVVRTADHESLEIELCDGRMRCGWNADPGTLPPGRLHHVAIIVDGGPKIITFVVDGILCDGGKTRQFGWGRFPPSLGSLNSSAGLRIAPAFRGTIHTLRVYNRYLRTSEAVANFNAKIPRAAAGTD